MAAEVTYLERPVQILRAEADTWSVLEAGTEVFEGDTIRTGRRGRAEITISSGRVFRIGSASLVELKGMHFQRDSLRARLRVLAGRLWSALTDPLDHEREEFTVSTETATLGVKGTRFDVDYDAPAKTVQTLVLEGEVEAKPVAAPAGPPAEVIGPQEIAPPQEISRDEWTVIVNTNQKLVFTAGGDPVLSPIVPDDLDDEWVRFNEARDAAMP